jgi:NAD+ synthase (glutamine-hydrolysing)
VIAGGRVRGVYHKIFLPNYGVFDEARYFTAGSKAPIFAFAGDIFGINICEDLWHADGPTRAQAAGGAGFIINISASPYHAGKTKEREVLVRAAARKNKVALIYANLVGGQDELVFDGQSMIVDRAGNVMARGNAFEEDLIVTDIELPARKADTSRHVVQVAGELPHGVKAAIPKRAVTVLDPTEEVYKALLLGLKDYAAKNGFKKAAVAVSGGIDSALVAALAADALGKDNVTAVFMPSRYSSQESREDAAAVAGNLDMKFLEISIEQMYKMYLLALEGQFAGMQRDLTEENIQARIRGNIMMALSNKFGWLVLTTGNKSEMSTGYATLYGDMAGGFAVIKDAFKTLVYKLAKYRNSLGSVIPERVITKEPTAELRPNQKDADTLPPYDVLDPILKAYIIEDRGLEEIVALGFDRDMACRVLNMVDKSEYKRRQSPPGIKITPKAFGRDRRMPITNRYKEY